MTDLTAHALFWPNYLLRYYIVTIDTIIDTHSVVLVFVDRVVIPFWFEEVLLIPMTFSVIFCVIFKPIQLIYWYIIVWYCFILLVTEDVVLDIDIVDCVTVLCSDYDGY